jgi:arylsulfatase B
LRWTLIPAKMKAAGYKTHWIGKGHTGYKSVLHLPTHRGFDSYLGYLSGAQSYTSDDRWANGGPLSNNTSYSSQLYGDLAVDLIHSHPKSEPFFLYLAWQAVHSPYDDVPNWNNSCTEFLPYPGVYAGMIYDSDQYTGKMVDALTATGMWVRLWCSFPLQHRAETA